MVRSENKLSKFLFVNDHVVSRIGEVDFNHAKATFANERSLERVNRMRYTYLDVERCVAPSFYLRLNNDVRPQSTIEQGDFCARDARKRNDLRLESDVCRTDPCRECC